MPSSRPENADFGSTLHFPTGVPVFHLPAGYSVSSEDAGIVDNQVPCTSNCTRFQSKCDAGKFAMRREAAGVSLARCTRRPRKRAKRPSPRPCRECLDTFGACLGKLEAKQKPREAEDALHGDRRSRRPHVGGRRLRDRRPWTTIDRRTVDRSGERLRRRQENCVLQKTACSLKLLAAATKKGVLVDPAADQKCADKFDGGAKGFDKGCIG
jgi:hypothetical protein